MKTSKKYACSVPFLRTCAAFVLGAVFLAPLSARATVLSDKSNRAEGLLMASATPSFMWQERIVSGRVVDENKEPIPGVNVIIKGTTEGTQTDLDGRYTLGVKQGQSLLFTFVGMRTLERAVGDADVMDVTMEEDAKQLEEVIVVAYGEQSKRAITGSIAQVSSKAMQSQISASPLRALQGATPGVSILTQGGQPGNNPLIRIRGFSSVNADAEPLIIVDGAQFNGDLSSISNDQIAEVSVLKDASAAALYGSRGANGVILISTRKGTVKGGQAVQPTVTFTSRVGISNQAVKPHRLVGATDYYRYGWEAMRNGYVDASKSDTIRTEAQKAADAIRDATDNLIPVMFDNYNATRLDRPVGTDGVYLDSLAGPLYWETDWLDVLLRDNPVYTENTLTFSGGGPRTSYALTMGQFNQQGNLIDSDFTRYSARFSVTSRVKDWLEVGTSTGYSASNQNAPNQSGSSFTSALLWYYVVPSVYPVYRRDANGDVIYEKGRPVVDYGAGSRSQPNSNRSVLNNENPLGYIRNSEFSRRRYSLFSSNYIKIDFSKHVQFETRFGYENYSLSFKEYDYSEGGSAASVRGRVEERRDQTESFTFTNSLTYRNTFGAHHNVSAKALVELYNYRFTRATAQGTGFVPGARQLASSTTPEFVTGYIDQERLFSWLGNVTYNYAGRYYFDASFRADGSSRFRPEHRWGYFFSVGANWVLTAEKFMQPLADVVDLLKLRASYGALGNNRLQKLEDDGTYTQLYFPYLRNFTSDAPNGDRPGVLFDDPADPDITWETSKTLNVGLDYGFLDNRLTGSVEYYIKDTEDLLFEVPIPASSGAQNIPTNFGAIRNSGVEFTITGEVVRTKDFSASINLNLATLKNEFTELPQEKIIFGTKQYKVGVSLYEFFIQEYADVNPENGNMRWWKDILDNDGNPTGEREKTEKYDDATRYYQGKSIPDFSGGFGFNVSYKGFALGTVFSYAYGAKIYDSQYARLLGSGFEGFDASSALSPDVASRWQQPGDITDVPRLTASRNDFEQISTRYLFDNDFIRFRNLTFSYDFKREWMERIRLQGLQLNFTAENLVTWQSHPGLDPEQSFAGLTNYHTPLLRTYSFGVTVRL